MSELCKQSMKRLTQQVMQADLASRKNRMTTSKSFYFGALFLTSPAYYILYQMFFPTGPICSITAQAGDPHTFYVGAHAARVHPIRALFRPGIIRFKKEIFYQDKLSNLDEQAQRLKEIIGKNENVKFNAYVWH